MPPGLVITKAWTKAEVDSIDWDLERQTDNHPVKVRMVGNQVVEYFTGEVIAEVNPKYRLYWNHSHVHFAPIGWNGTYSQA